MVRIARRKNVFEGDVAHGQSSKVRVAAFKPYFGALRQVKPGWIVDRHEVPPKGLNPRRGIRPRPWIYSETEIEQIVITTAALPSRSGLRGATCSTLYDLIAVTGLRIGEALGLDDRDDNAVNATLGDSCEHPPPRSGGAVTKEKWTLAVAASGM